MKVGVIGAGTMGQGIAKAFAQVEGYEVALCDIKQEWAEGGKEKIKKGYARLVEKGKMTQEAVDGILAKITPGLKEDLCKDCDLIVEAAFENMEVKKTTFKELDEIAKPDCIFASNTSSLSITEIGNGLNRPMVGMHFFNPADRMKLIEVIAGVNTPDETVSAIKKISEEIGKTPVQVDYVTEESSYSYGETKEEEQKRMEAEEAAVAKAEAEAQAAEAAAQSVASGQEVIDYACQFIGNPYVWGGTSLTDGADCSGFVQSVYAHFGISLPRTSYEQRSAGYEVSYEDAQPGDLILYEGHVGLYIGNDQIVNAMNEDQGIGISSATYTDIVAVRRIY